MNEDLHALRGHGTPAQYERLRELASEVRLPSCIVEIGTFRGKATCFLASGSRDEVSIYTIDPHDLPGVRRPTGVIRSKRSYSDPRIAREARANIATHAEPGQVQMIQGFSHEVGVQWDGPPVGLLYVDGDHREGAVRRDFSAWHPHLSAGAIVVFDDHYENFPGVMLLVSRLLEKGIIREMEQLDGMLITERIK